jgi:hypothetical protein
LPFHVEIRSGHRWAREFNVDETTLRDSVLEPWVRNQPVLLGDREWEPAESALRVLEGPELSPPDLAFGRGWGAAEHTGQDVARELIGSAGRRASRIAVLAETEEARDLIADAVHDFGLQSVTWSLSLVGDPGEAAPAAIVLAVESAEPSRAWMYEAGAAVGALGGRAVVVQFAGACPPELDALESLEPGDDLRPRLAEALGRVGV